MVSISDVLHTAVEFCAALVSYTGDPMMNRLIHILSQLTVLLTFASSPALGETILPYDVISYDLSVKLDFENSPEAGLSYRYLFSPLNTMEGEAKIVLRNAAPEPLHEISLIFNRLLTPKEILVNDEAPEFHSILRGLKGRESLQVLQVTVALPQPLARGDQTQLTIRYGGQLMGYPESGMLYTRETLDPDFTILRSETFCYPLVALPTRDSTSTSMRTDVFDQKLKITVPAGHIAVNGGRFVGSEKTDGKATYSYASHEQASTILIPIAPYQLVTVGSHRIYHFSDSTEGAENLTRLLDQAVELLSSWLGPLPVERGLVIAEIPEFFGSQAGPLIIQTSGAFRDPDKYGEFYHELSHLWNPNDIDPTPSRWNEGLAMFLQVLVETRLSELADLDTSFQETFEHLKNRLSENEELHAVAMINFGKNEMTDLSYSTGQLLFGLLMEQVGEKPLLDFLATYLSEHQKTGSRDSDFAAELVAALGEDTADLMDEWFLGPHSAEQILEAASWDDLRGRFTTSR